MEIAAKFVTSRSGMLMILPLSAVIAIAINLRSELGNVRRSGTIRQT